MAIKTSQQIVADFTGWLQSRFTQIDTTAGRPLNSLLLVAIANDLAQAYIDLNQVQIDQGIGNPNNSTPDGLDALAFNWNIDRKLPIPATGFVTFRKLAQPQNTIIVGSTDGTGGVVLTTSRLTNSTVVSFVTTQTVYFTPSSPFNSQTGFYEVSAPIQAITAGVTGNVEAGQITVMSSSVPGVDFVTNYVATTGGLGQESNSSEAFRIQAQVLGTHAGIVNGLISTALSQQGVIDAKVVGPNDAEFERHGVDGAVDLVVLGSQITPAVDVFNYVTNMPFYTPINRPVTAIETVSATVGFTYTTLTPGFDYVFSQDTVSTDAYSDLSNDQLSWLNGNHPNNGTPVTVSYEYNQLIPAIQNVVSQPNVPFVTANVLVKAGLPVLVDIWLTVRALPGTNQNVVSNNVATAITNYVNNLVLGQSVLQSNLVVAIQAAQGVGSILLPFTKLALRTASQGVQDLAMNKYQYARIDETSLQITVTES